MVTNIITHNIKRLKLSLLKTLSKKKLNQLQLIGMAYVYRWPNRVTKMSMPTCSEMMDCAQADKCLNLGIQSYHNRSLHQNWTVVKLNFSSQMVNVKINLHYFLNVLYCKEFVDSLFLETLFLWYNSPVKLKLYILITTQIINSFIR